MCLLSGSVKSAMVVRARVHVHGSVQGVGFRYFVLHHARRLGVRGYVRNCPDGRVEAVLEGEQRAVEGLLALMRSGPPAARVQRLEVQWEEPSGSFAHFDIR